MPCAGTPLSLQESPCPIFGSYGFMGLALSPAPGTGTGPNASGYSDWLKNKQVTSPG